METMTLHWLTPDDKVACGVRAGHVVTDLIHVTCPACLAVAQETK